MKLEDVINKLAPELFKNKHIHALWLEGSYATGKQNEHSDIDVWMDVDDGTFDQCFEVFHQNLSKIGKIDWHETRGNYSEEPRLAKRNLHIEGFPREQTIELDLQEHSRNFIFKKNVHVIKVLFDKDDTIKWHE